MLISNPSFRIIYPHSYPEFKASGKKDEDLLEILQHVHLAYLPNREGGLDTRKEWKDVLSGGEKQRVSNVELSCVRVCPRELI
jgi:ATP-binding cassette subfamily D (ALD) long-chain fatty acid import protein